VLESSRFYRACPNLVLLGSPRHALCCEKFRVPTFLALPTTGSPTLSQKCLNDSNLSGLPLVVPPLLLHPLAFFWSRLTFYLSFSTLPLFLILEFFERLTAVVFLPSLPQFPNFVTATVFFFWFESRARPRALVRAIASPRDHSTPQKFPL